MPNKLKDPVNDTLPEFCAPVVIADCIVSDPLPDFLRNSLPSGTFIANSPACREEVVGIDPGVKLRFCLIAIVYINLNEWIIRKPSIIVHILIIF